VWFLDEMCREEDKPTRYVGALLGSGPRRSTSATQLDRSRESRWALCVCETYEVWHLRHLALYKEIEHDPEDGYMYDYINHVLAER
jgi:hypothetical protein